MVKESGWKNVGVAQKPENDENCDGATVTNLVDQWMVYPNPNSNNIEVDK